MAERKIIHVDMDAFFASVEQLDNPDLRGRPIAVGHDAPRSVVATASYEARRYGVRSAQPMSQAKRRCAQLVIVEPHFSRYREVSERVHEIFHRYTDMVEPISLDEAFLDVTDNKKGIAMAMDIAKEIRQSIYDELHLTASAGVSCNKLIAKIASDFRKPNGLTVVHPARVLDFLESLPVEDLWGVGPKTKQKMHDLMVHTCGELRRVPIDVLKQEFGKMGQVFYDYCRGIDDRPVVNDWIRKSVGCEATFDTDISKRSAAIIVLYQAVVELVQRIAKCGFEGRTLTLKVKFSDFTQVTRSITQGKVLKDKDDILPLAKQLLQKVDYADHAFRLLGLSVSRSDSDHADEEERSKQWHTGELPFKPY